jgi:hypothetical protein
MEASLMGTEKDDPIRLAVNESLLRERNEQSVAPNAAHHWVNPPFADWTCECGNENCVEPVRLTIEEYEAIRAEPTRFFIRPSPEHVTPEVEVVVQREERYWVVEKTGIGVELSEELDPRSAG